MGNLKGAPLREHGHTLALILTKAYGDLKSEAEKVYLSYLWWIVEPLLRMSVYYVVFGLLFQRGTQDYVPFLLIGLVPWRWTSSAITEGAGSLVNGKNLMRLVYIPKYFFPAVSLVTQSFKFLVVFLILLVYLACSGRPPGLAYLSLPLLLLAHLLLIAGASFLLSALYPFLPDLRLAVDTALGLGFFVSGIFFEASTIPAQYHRLFFLNPFAHLFQAYRDILLHQRPPELSALPLLMLAGLGLLGLALLLLRRWDRHYPKVLR
jgi:lipopolysaccharide transport system permease protein